jgi:hypothetical protein
MPTEAKDIFEAQSRSLRELLSENGLGLYLPPYQRPYGWGKDKVAKLIDDTLHGLQSLVEAQDSFTFLGTVITIHDVNHVTIHPVLHREVPLRVLNIIDGQQRISTLMLLITCLHNLIRQRHWDVFKGKTPGDDDVLLTALNEESITLLHSLGMAFYEKKDLGDTPIYPRIIRAFHDQWAKNSKDSKYSSPIAHLLYEYATIVDRETNPRQRPTDFRPKPREGVEDGEVDLVRRFKEIRDAVSALSRDEDIEEFERLPTMHTLANNPEFQRALFNHPLEKNFCDWIENTDDQAVLELVRLVMLGAYVLNRIALTVVRGKNEDYAFTIFESLNTTGEPLTAFETFLPRVVMKEGLEVYQNSAAHEQMKAVQKHLSRFPVGDRLQNATRELLVTFALAETGAKLSKRLTEQRAYLREEFDRHKDSEHQRLEFLRHLKDTSTFVGETWKPESDERELTGLGSSAMTDTVRLCLSFLVKMNHSITVAPLIRFYSEALHATGDNRPAKVREFEEALKAVTAFTTLWRASRRTTGNIDSEYREVMSGESSLTGMGPLARQHKKGHVTAAPAVNVANLKAELRARLMSSKHGGISSREDWISQAGKISLYEASRPLTRFLLLAAYHDSVEDLDQPGLIKIGRTGVAPCFTERDWEDERHLTLEHIAPQGRTPKWDEEFYSDKSTVHRIGNLVLTPTDANSSLHSRPWQEKRVLYGALSARTPEDAKQILDKAETDGMVFPLSTKQLTDLSSYLPHLNALYLHREPWTPESIAVRGERILQLAYARLAPWLGLDLA